MNSNESYINIPLINGDTNFWMVRTKRGFFFDEFITQGYIAIGWNAITKSMIGTSLSKGQADRLKEYIKEDYGENKPGTSLNKCIRFCNELKNGDIAVIVDNGRIAFAYIGEYYEESSANLTVELEKEIHDRIEKATHGVEKFKCPYIKRRRIEVIKVMGDDDTVSPYLQGAIVRNWHSLSDLNEHAETVLSACFDTFVFKGSLTLTFRVRQKKDINVLDLANFVLNAAKIVSDGTPENVSVKTTLHSPGDIILQICNFVQENQFFLLLCYIAILGGKVGNCEFNSPLGVIKSLINAKHNKEKKALELKKLSFETDLLEQEVIGKKLANIEKSRALQLNSVETCAEPLSKAAENLELLTSENTIQDVVKAIEQLNENS